MIFLQVNLNKQCFTRTIQVLYRSRYQDGIPISSTSREDICEDELTRKEPKTVREYKNILKLIEDKP